MHYSKSRQIRKDDPGHPEGCAVFALTKIYDPENSVQTRSDCEEGKLGCIGCKKKLNDILNNRLAPIREKRSELILHPEKVDEILAAGADKARKVASETMAEIRTKMNLG